MTESFKSWLADQGYTPIIVIPSVGVCSIRRMIFTTGLFVNMDELGYQYRYCYQTRAEALSAIESWNGEGHPPGDWVKRKGEGGDLSNPEQK